jgi:cellulose synthase/poly-beta-1,6-N-acetylglucosamine synthase-like glycosyltransferase
LSKLKVQAGEVIIIDQSTDSKTKEVYFKYKKRIRNLKYYYSKKPSIAIAKNLGVSKLSNKSKVVIFLDDDAYVGKTYLKEIISGYKTHPEAAGIYGTPFSKKKRTISFKIINSIKRIFRLGALVRGDLFFKAPYDNRGRLDLNKEYKTEWFPGTDPSYKTEVFKELKFDENFHGWSLGEDIDIAYRIQKKFGPLYIVKADITHENPPEELNPQREIRRIYMNHINHLYLYYKLFQDMALGYIWNLIGISLFELFNLLKINKAPFNSLRFKHYIKSLYYCYKNKEKIKKGDLSLPIK